MVDLMLLPRPVLGLLPERHGTADGPAGVSVAEIVPDNVLSLAARAGGAPALSAAISARFGVALPGPGMFATAGDATMLWFGPERWLILSDTLEESALRDLAGANGSVTDQTDGRVFLRVSGPCVRAALAKGVTLDLEAAFRPGNVAQTLVDHMAMMLWQESASSYVLAGARSYAGSVWHWLEMSAAAFGIEVTG